MFRYSQIASSVQDFLLFSSFIVNSNCIGGVITEQEVSLKM